MRTTLILGLLGLLGMTNTAAAQAPPTPAPGEAEPPVRYGIRANDEKYPQATPKEALQSALEAVQARRYDYFLAHLADPEFVDARVKKLGELDDVVRETRKKLTDRPDVLKEWQRLLKDGDWSGGGATAASASLPDLPGRTLFLKKIGKRWVIENRHK